jgi:hypothetical protein
MHRLTELLCQLDLEPGEEDVLDVLWLAARIGQSPRAAVKDATRPAAPAKEPDSRAAAGDTRYLPPEPPGVEQTEDGSLAFYDRSGVADAIGGAQPATAVRTPAAPALEGQLRLAKSLRPLKQRIPSRQQLLIDEEATASRIADDGLWIPALTPAPTRWLEVALVVDAHESMSVWRRTVADVRKLLERLGTFRDVRSWILDHTDGDPAQVGVRRWQTGSVLRSPRELIDPAGNRVVIVVSDCLGPMWQSGAAQQTLADLGRRGPVVIFQPLPQRLWNYSHVRPVAAHLSAVQRGVPNSRWNCGPVYGSPLHRPKNSVPVPVLELDPVWLAPWSRLLAAAGTTGIDTMVLFAGGKQESAPGPAVPVKAVRTPRQRVQDFRATASPGATRLAECLAAVPVSMHVIRLVQNVMLGRPNQAQLAEVILGGLLYKQDTPGDIDLDDVLYEFIPGVREILIRRLRKGDALRILQEVSDFVGAQFGQARDFRALLAGADLGGEFLIGPDSRPFARVAAQVLGLLGGQYAEPAARLTAALSEAKPGSPGRTVPEVVAAPMPAEPGPSPLGDTAAGDAADRGFAAALAQVDFTDRRSKQRPLVCPYCYHAFAEREILFRCSGRASGGRAPCVPVRDEVVERKQFQPAMLPPVFPADARRDTAECPSCHIPTRQQVCPGCHSLLPATFRSVQGRLIALVGPSEAGKTAFMTVLIHELSTQAGERLNASTIGADETTQERFVSHYEWPMYRQSELNLTLRKQDHIAPLVFRFVMSQQSRFRPQPHELLLSFADSAGEDLVSNESIDLMARYLAAADAVIVLIDPLQFHSVRSQIPGTPMPRQARGTSEPLAVFERITSLLLAGTGREAVEKPVAIVLSKLDAIWPLLPPDDPLRAPKPLTSAFDDKDNVARQDQIRDMLDRWGIPGIDQVARQRYKLFRYFAVSAIGATPTADNKIPAEGIHPYRVMEPFMWLLNQFGFVKSM